MGTAEVQPLVAAVEEVDVSCRDRAVLTAAVASAARLRAWRLTLAPDRTLTIDLPDGTRRTSGPPRRGPS